MGAVTIKKEVETMQMVGISSKNIDGVIREGKTYLYFTAGFSPFAAAMEPVYEKFLAEAGQYDVKVCRINVTDDIALGERFQIKELPTLLVFRDGKLVNQAVGARPKAGVLALLE